MHDIWRLLFQIDLASWYTLIQVAVDTAGGHEALLGRQGREPAEGSIEEPGARVRYDHVPSPMEAAHW